jgi:hypothetical protein
LTRNNGNGTGLVQMRFSNDNAAWSPWEPFAYTKFWTLSSGYGTKTVYVQFKDAAGNVSKKEIKDTVQLMKANGKDDDKKDHEDKYKHK